VGKYLPISLAVTKDTRRWFEGSPPGDGDAMGALSPHPHWKKDRGSSFPYQPVRNVGLVPPSPAVKCVADADRDKPAYGSIYIPVIELLLVPEEPFWNDDVELILRSRHGHVQQPSLFLYVFGSI
jgi:hypothetical protein